MTRPCARFRRSWQFFPVAVYGHMSVRLAASTFSRSILECISCRGLCVDVAVTSGVPQVSVRTANKFYLNELYKKILLGHGLLIQLNLS